MIIKSIAHSAYACKHMEKSLHFYCDVLGLQKAFELNRDDGSPCIIYLKVCEGQFIELFYTDVNTPPFNKDHISYCHLCLEVFDINEACNSIRSAGYQLLHEPIQGGDLNWQAWVVDPDGNPVELMQINPASPQANA